MPSGIRRRSKRISRLTPEVTELSPDGYLAGRVVGTVSIPPREARYAEWPEKLHPELRAKAGADRLYVHQREAYDLILAGRDTMLTTGTSSGKTLGFALPIWQRIMREPFARGILVYPTKALAQDQLARLRALAPAGMRVETYDGDTPTSRRGTVRKSAHLVLTNPDMLHHGILPHHEAWGPFLRATRAIVLDEVHAYRGVFGSHVANVVRRTLRLCDHYRSRPTVVAGSATIGNPREHFLAMTGREASIVDDDGSPSGARTLLLALPPEVAPGEHASANAAVAEILAELAGDGRRVLAFSRARVSAELVLRMARSAGEGRGVDAAEIESYRAGYTPKERRAIEAALFKGKLKGLSATSAMELGVDVGGLDAVVVNGYPGSINSFRQQAGRAGRGGREGLVVLVGRDDPLDAYLLRHPERLVSGEGERVSVRPENPAILTGHLRRAAYEVPISPSETSAFPEGALDLLEDLERQGEMEFQGGAFVLPAGAGMRFEDGLRGDGSAPISLIVDGQEIGTMERWRALTSAHAGAVYLHRGASFVVEELDLVAGVAYIRAENADHYTQTMVETTLTETATGAGDGQMRRVDVTVSELVIGFVRKPLEGGAGSDIFPLELPPNVFDTTAVRLALPPRRSEQDPVEAAAGWHGAEHALLAMAPLIAGCDRADLGSAWFAAAAPEFEPCVYVYDRAPGGVGLAQGLFADRAAWAKAAHRLVAECPCREGCPSCLLSARCESRNENLSKPATAGVLAWLTERLRP